MTALKKVIKVSETLLLTGSYFERQLEISLRLNFNPFTSNHTILWDLIVVYIEQNIHYCKQVLKQRELKK